MEIKDEFLQIVGLTNNNINSLELKNINTITNVKSLINQFIHLI